MIEIFFSKGIEIVLERLSGRAEKVKLRRNARIQALATLFAATADCLDEMRTSLASREIPYGVGTRLRAHIVQYAFDCRDEDFTPREQASIAMVLERIRSALTAGDFEDDILGGRAVHESTSEQRRTDLLIDLKRAAGRLRGESETLRLHIE
jgi:hypothetical protein